MPSRNRWALAITALLLSALTTAPAWARFASGDAEPVDRLVTNVESYVKANPGDPQGYYTLARIHNLAASRKSNMILAAHFQDGAVKRPLPSLIRREDHRPVPASNPALKSIAESQVIEHIKASIANYRLAIDAKPKDPLFILGLACVLELGADYADKIGPVPTAQNGKTNDAPQSAPADQLKRDWLKAAADQFLLAHTLAFADEYRDGEKNGVNLGELVSYEAADSFLRIMKVLPTDKASNQDIAAVIKNKKQLENIDGRWVTPIIFNLTRPTELAELLAPDTHVPFDLDGTGRPQTWPWLQPTTGVLVWDPQRTGVITSGRQLFGNVTFWMFWRDGYHALDALDDNRDGWLAGDELPGLAVWFDRNADGISDSGEVIAIEKLGIAGISVHATSHEGDSPCNREGLKMKDGRALPTYDWVAQRAR